MANRTSLILIALLSLFTGLAAADEQVRSSPVSRPLAQRKANRPLQDRVFIGVNGGFQSNDLTFADTRTDPWFGESVSWTADYDVKSGPEFDVSAGVRLWRHLLAQATYARFTDTRAAVIAGQVPHPFFFGQPRPIDGESAALKQEEHTVHVAAAWVAPAGRHFDVSVFGGPSVYLFKRDLVADVRYSEAYPYDAAAFSSTALEQVSERAIGFNVGADVTWRLTRVVGLGAVVRFTRASISMDSPANDRRLSVDAGGLQAGAGLRFRFGGRAPARALPPPTRAPIRPVPEPTGREGRPQPTRPESRPQILEPDPSPESIEAPATRSGSTAVLKVDAPVYILPDAKRTPLEVLRAGARLTVRKDTGEWLEVEFSDPRWGARVGFIQKENVE